MKVMEASSNRNHQVLNLSVSLCLLNGMQPSHLAPQKADSRVHPVYVCY